MPASPPAHSAILASPFRPFGLAGTAYGVALMAAWVVAQAAGAGGGATRWHGHEMLFGFAGAIVCAITLTALPGWSGTREVRGAPLAALVGLWALARVAFWVQERLPPLVSFVLACAPWVALATLLAFQLARIADRRLLLVPLVFAAIAAGEAWAIVSDERAGAAMALYAIVTLFALAGGVFTPVFTRTHLRLHGRGEVPPALPALEYASLAALLVLAVTDVANARPEAIGTAALVAGALHAWRCVRWRGWRVRDTPLLWTMHAGYAWMVAALLLEGLGGLGVHAAQRAWLHAFTVGALASMMIGLLTRVVLRHTGRPLVLSSRVVAAFALVQAAAVLRVAGALIGGDAALTIAAGLAWCGAFALYLAAFAPYLVAPSLPRDLTPLALDSRRRREAR